MFKAMLALIALFLVATFPATWLLMLFLGNIGTNVGYWGTLPAGTILAMLTAGAASGFSGRI